MNDFASYLPYIKELRNRLARCFVVFCVATIVCYTKSAWIFHMLARPLESIWQKNGGALASRYFIYTHLSEAFLVHLKVAAFGGLFLAFPYVAFELWRFVAPGLFSKERCVFLLFLLCAPLLFFAGALFAYMVVLPLAYEFF